MGEAWTFPAKPDQELEGGGFSLLAEGRYKFGINDKEDTTSKAGDPMVKLTLVVLEGSEQGGMIHRLVKSEPPDESTPSNKKAQFGLMLHFLHAVGLWAPDPDGGETEVNFDTDDFIGREFWADVVHKPYQDKKTGEDKMGQEIGRVYTEEQIAAEGAPAEAPAEEAPAEEAPAEEPAPKPKAAPKPAVKAAPKAAPKPAPKPAPRPAPKPAPKRKF